MAPLFPWPGRLLKETPIREESISGVRPRGHAQVRLLFMSEKPMKTLQPTLLTPTRLALWQTEEEFLLELKTHEEHSALAWPVVCSNERRARLMPSFQTNCRRKQAARINGWIKPRSYRTRPVHYYCEEGGNQQRLRSEFHLAPTLYVQLSAGTERSIVPVTGSGEMSSSRVLGRLWLQTKLYVVIIL
ncbi:hypothetical protein FQN60_009047 [Etheostoma spectabile]|uniref:Uncharacterized protein n=1 Tax=Etheostoma spectabile TaxID=54343 RepID=A0A5J5CKQ2_9PERO|nr:hypothetical protein FQN60_009047 [Etheostoma spectabile]